MSRWVLGIATALSLSWSHAAIADVTDECIEAHERGQQPRLAGHLQAARKALLTCSRDPCPAVILADCRPWLNTSREEQPSVVFGVHDENGNETSDVRITLDGELLTTRLDGGPVDVDPGDHVLRFERGNLAPLEQKLFLRVGERERLVSVSFARAGVPTPDASPRSRWSAAAIVSGLVGTTGLGLFAGFGIAGKLEESHLAGTCRPNCDASRIDGVRNQYIVAYTSLGVGLVALGISIGLLARSPPRSSSAAIHWGIAPLVGGGASATMVGRF